MTDREDIDMLAAEYVLGTLDASERESVEARRTNEPDLEAAIGHWQTRLIPLVDYVEGETPSTELLERIEAEIERRSSPADRQAGGAEIVRLATSLRRWRMTAIAASAVAAALATLLVVGPGLFAPQQTRYVAVFNEGDRQPSFVMSVDLETRELTIRPVTAEDRPDMSYELWIVADEIGPAPKSLGLLESASSPTRKPIAYDSSLLRKATFGISVEPEGGSPTGRPTGPALHGKLIPTDD